MAFSVVIPARYASTRLPAKPLLDIGGKPMIQHVYERAQSSGAEQVVIATDDERIQTCVQGFGGEVVMTDAAHTCGTERLEEVVRLYGWTDDHVVVNLQGDEPFMPASVIESVAQALIDRPDCVMTTLAEAVEHADQVTDPNTVKVVLNEAGYALYFSRASIPYGRDQFPLPKDEPVPAGWYRHIGLYGYRASFLRDYVSWSPCPLELTESLEQLRVLWHGYGIHVTISNEDTGFGIDTPDDLEKAREYYQSSM